MENTPAIRARSFTYLYAKTIIDLMIREKNPKGKFLLIGGGIANFTDVASTFKGIIKALKEYEKQLKRKPSQDLRAARGTQLPRRLMPNEVPRGEARRSDRSLWSRNPYDQDCFHGTKRREMTWQMQSPPMNYSTGAPRHSSTTTRLWPHKECWIFDYASGRGTPSVAAIINPTGVESYAKFFFGKREILIPIFKSIEKAAKMHPDVDVMINFASFRSAATSTEDALAIPQIRTIVIIAEGVPRDE